MGIKYIVHQKHVIVCIIKFCTIILCNCLLADAILPQVPVVA